ncbi:hypothetical protein O7635_34565 [Asanoa sp. WMMD1127]|uniref:hypothetical protein n=1 Tax=Asanoa sp. WMMD1127 TaxID=3016107 RepID=UPI002415A14B|nr:hypothetical protein [Asanoa sp. WMMD1127]MDG4826997.1 hypothetical protein [Asanoa sp. WMMD1127]
MPNRDWSRLERRLNTYPSATNGQRLTAIVVALVASLFVGGLCVWLASGVLDGVHPGVQWVVFAVIGAVAGFGLLSALSWLTGRNRRA